MKLNDNVIGNIELAAAGITGISTVGLVVDGIRRKKSYKTRSEAMDESISAAAESVASDMNPEDLADDDDEEEADEQPAPEENDSEDAE